MDPQEKDLAIVVVDADTSVDHYNHTEYLRQEPKVKTTTTKGKFVVCGGSHQGGVLCTVSYDDARGKPIKWRMFFVDVSSLDAISEQGIHLRITDYERIANSRERREQYIAKHKAMYAEGKKIVEDAIAKTLAERKAMEDKIVEDAIAKTLAERKAMEDKNVGLISASLEQNPELIVRVFQTNPDLIAHVFRSSPDLIAQTFRSNPDILTSILRGELKALMPEIVAAMIAILDIKC
jgi:hypothetical protein